MDYIGLGFDSIDTLYVAGRVRQLPEHSKVGGHRPSARHTRWRKSNSSATVPLPGARACLLSADAFETCVNISRSMTNIELSTHQPFTDEYIAALFLPHTDGKTLPFGHLWQMFNPEEVKMDRNDKVKGTLEGCEFFQGS
jgi:uncharacterized 2Fe-2S/4Fe-4S cluster protein (DUF4445 family)